MIIIRLKQQSLGNNLSYSIIVSSNQVAPSSGKFLEKLGYYKPLVDSWSNKYIYFDFDRLKFWLTHGATIHVSLFVLMRPAFVYYYWTHINSSIKKIKS